MKRIWVLGIGPLMVDCQFIDDVSRIDIYVRDVLLPKNIFDALEVLYTTFGNDYFFYTQYGNQTLGNWTYQIVKASNHLICRRYIIRMYVGRIEAHIQFDVFDNDLRLVDQFACVSVKTKQDFCIYL